MAVKSRVTGAGSRYVGRLIQRDPLNLAVIINDTSYFSTHKGFERLALSEGHPFHNKYLRSRGHDLGGIFGHHRYAVESSPAQVSVRSSSGSWTYEGDIYAFGLNRTFDQSSLPTLTPQSTLEGYGATGYNRAKPTASQMGVGQFIGELREIPRLPKFLALRNAAQMFFTRNPGNIKFSAVAKEVSGNYLNYEFGWKPFLKDLKEFLQQTRHIEKVLQQLSRDNMRWVHRNATILNEEDRSVTYTSNQMGNPVLPTPLVAQLGRQVRTITVARRVWFSGKFRYYIPTGNSVLDVEQRKRQLARIVYGAELSPKLVWQLMRNSWLFDWVVNIGDNISNLSDNAADSLVCRYAYSMDNRITTTDYEIQNVILAGGVRPKPSHREISESKGRARAGPYGFALKPGNFSARQTAILTALGINRYG